MRLLLAFVTSLAACCATATAGDWYTGIYGGANWNHVIEDVDFVDNKTGAVIGATVGKRAIALPGLRLEADLSYRTNDVDLDLSKYCGPSCTALTIQHETTALMFNAAYDFGSGPIKPYVLVGGGYANTQATFEDIALVRLEASGLAYQAGAGVNVEVAPGARVGLGYRFFQGPALDPFDGFIGDDLSNGQNHSAIASLSFDM